MKAEWIHTDDGLTIEVTATSDIDRTNFNSFFLDKPHRARLRVTKTMRDAAKNYAGLHLSFLQYADSKNLERDGFTKHETVDFAIFYAKKISKSAVYLLNTGVRRLKVIEMIDGLDATFDVVIETIKSDLTLTEYEGNPIIDLGNVRTMGQIKQRLRKNI